MNEKFNELRNSQNQFDKWLSAIEEKLVDCIVAQNKQMLDNLSEQVGKQINEFKEHIDAKFYENKEVKFDQVVDNEIGDFINKDEILSSSNDEISVGVESSGEVAVDEFERECKVRLGESKMQTANFPCGLRGVRGQQVVIEDKGSSRGYVGDTVSQSGPIDIFCGIPNKARMFNSEFFMPFVRSEVVVRLGVGSMAVSYTHLDVYKRQ